MKLISLNCWCGRALEPLLTFVREASATTDIFCFQEVLMLHSGTCAATPDMCPDLYARLAGELPGFQGFYVPMQAGYGPTRKSVCDISFGEAIFMRKGLAVGRYGDHFVYRERNGLKEGERLNFMPRTVQFVEFVAHGTRYTVCNFHGLATWPKDDTPERLSQSRLLAAFLATINGAKVLCGDFNIAPDTESIRIVGQGMYNLVQDSGVITTRSTLSEFAYSEISDYIFVSPDVAIRSFELPAVEVSDHLPLVLEFS
ncbi:MAG: endonuclease/exonuclease/phosphatase family protein [bacterium]|nr:endonuclease/exonuclease/phosphatase family protein [bacterium]